MFAFKLDQAKSMFFDRQAILKRMDRAQSRVFNRVGALTRKIARNSIKNISKSKLGRIYAKLGELKHAHGAKRAEIQREIDTLRRSAHSRPGQPPKSVTGLLKKFILYGYDQFARSVVIGPTLLNKPSGAPERLEYGGPLQIGPRTVQMEPRPYMGPAREKVEPQIAGFFKDSLAA